MEAWEHDGDFRASIAEDTNIRGFLNDSALERVFSVDRQLKNVDAIFDRVFPNQHNPCK
jgi:adenylosuccinate lyase